MHSCVSITSIYVGHMTRYEPSISFTRLLDIEEKNIYPPPPPISPPPFLSLAFIVSLPPLAKIPQCTTFTAAQKYGEGGSEGGREGGRGKVVDADGEREGKCKRRVQNKRRHWTGG